MSESIVSISAGRLADRPVAPYRGDIYIVSDSSTAPPPVYFADSDRQWQILNPSIVIPAAPPTGLQSSARLTLRSGHPASVLSAFGNTVFLSAYNGSLISLYNGTSWNNYQITEIAQSIPTVANTNYDVFVYVDPANNLELELLAWSNDLARASEVIRLPSGAWVKQNDMTRRLFGTVRTSATGEGKDALESRFVSNLHNQILKPIFALDPGTSETYTCSNTGWQSARNASSFYIEYVAATQELASAVMLNLDTYAFGAFYYSGLGRLIEGDWINSAQGVGGSSVEGSAHTTRFQNVEGNIGYDRLYALERVLSGTATVVSKLASTGFKTSINGFLAC
jgi:hypothetical protein